MAMIRQQQVADEFASDWGDESTTGAGQELGTAVIVLCAMYGTFLVAIILMNLGWL